MLHTHKSQLVIYFSCRLVTRVQTIKVLGQIDNTPVVIQSLGDSFKLHWKQRQIGLYNTERSKWIEDTSFHSYNLVIEHNTRTMIII